MKVLMVGGKGTLGSAIAKDLGSRHEIIIASRHKGDIPCDITSEESIKAMFEQTGHVDAVICTVSGVPFGDFSQMTADKYMTALKQKLMSQVNLVLIGAPFIRDRGSFTLTSGVIGLEYIKTGSSAAMVNRGLEGFVKGVYPELPRQIRINVVCPTIVLESHALYGSLFAHLKPVPAAQVAAAYRQSVEGSETGEIYQVLS